MTRSFKLLVRLSAVMALVLLAAPLAAERAEALTRLGPAPKAMVPEMLAGTPAPLILVGSTRSRNAARARGFRQPHQLHGRTHAKRTQKFVFQGAKRFNIPRQFRGLRDFSSSVNTRLLRKDEAVRNPRIINRNPAVLYNRPLASGKLITPGAVAEPPGFSALPEDDPSVQVLRGDGAVQQAAKSLQAQQNVEHDNGAKAPPVEYDFSAY